MRDDHGTGKTVYLITPFVDGGELFDWIAESGSAPENVVRRMFRQIVDGMKVCWHGSCFSCVIMTAEPVLLC